MLLIAGPFSIFNVILWLFTAITLYKSFHLFFSLYMQTLYYNGYFVLKINLTLIFNIFFIYYLIIVFCNIFMVFKITFIYFYINNNDNDLYNICEQALKIKNIKISLFNLIISLITFIIICKITLLFILLQNLIYKILYIYLKT